MADKQYQIQSEHTSGSTAKHYHGVSISTLNEWAKNNIPSNAVVSSLQVYYKGKCSLGDTELYVGFSDDSSDEPGQKLISEEISTSAGSGWYGNIPSYSSTYPFNINTSYSTLSVYMNSGILYKKFTCYDFRVIYNYYIPTYTLTVKAGTGGTVSGGGTFESGKTATITAIADLGYKFKQWNDGNTSASRTVTVNGNVTYTAEFIPKEYTVSIDYEVSESGEKCTVIGAGAYKFGDTVTLQVTNIPEYHSFNGWDIFGLAKVYQYDTETITFTLNADTVRDDGTNIVAACYISHIGYQVNVELLPYDYAGATYYGDWGLVDGKEIYYNEQRVPVNGFKVMYADREYIWIKAIPEAGYTFLSWQDGDTANPRKIVVTGDITYIAIFKVNRIHVGTQLPKAIYIGTQEVKEIYAGAEKIYG